MNVSYTVDRDLGDWCHRFHFIHVRTVVREGPFRTDQYRYNSLEAWPITCPWRLCTVDQLSGRKSRFNRNYQQGITVTNIHLVIPSRIPLLSHRIAISSVRSVKWQEWYFHKQAAWFMSPVHAFFAGSGGPESQVRAHWSKWPTTLHLSPSSLPCVRFSWLLASIFTWKMKYLDFS